MKKLLVIAGLLWASAASAQFTPGQVLTAAELNSQFALYAPLTGATFTGPVVATGITATPISGSTGSFTNLTATGTVTFPGGTFPPSSLAAQAANTALANTTASSTTPSAVSLPSCSTSTSSLQYTSGTGFTCFTGSAPTASPTFTGIPAAPTAGAGTNTTQLATTANVIANFATPPTTGFGSTTPEPVSATTLNASANDSLLYNNTSGQSIANGTATTITGWTKIFDRLSTNFNASTGIFTAPATGYYHVDAGVFYGSGTNLAATLFEVLVIGNGVNDCLGLQVSPTVVSTAMAAQTSCDVFLSSGQTISVQTLQGSGATRTLGASGPANYLSIQRVP